MMPTKCCVLVALCLVVGCGASEPCTTEARYAALVTVDGADVETVEARLEDGPWIECSPMGERFACGSQMLGTVTLRATDTDGRQAASTIESDGDHCGPYVPAPDVTLVIE